MSDVYITMHHGLRPESSQNYDPVVEPIIQTEIWTRDRIHKICSITTQPLTSICRASICRAIAMVMKEFLCSPLGSLQNPPRVHVQLITCEGRVGASSIWEKFLQCEKNSSIRHPTAKAKIDNRKIRGQ